MFAKQSSGSSLEKGESPEAGTSMARAQRRELGVSAQTNALARLARAAGSLEDQEISRGSSGPKPSRTRVKLSRGSTHTPLQ